MKPSIVLAEGWLWKRFGVNGWGAQARDTKDCCYISKRYGLITCIGRVPYSVRVDVANSNGASPI